MLVHPVQGILPCGKTVAAKSKKMAGSISNPIADDCAMPAHYSLAPPIWVIATNARFRASTVARRPLAPSGLGLNGRRIERFRGHCRRLALPHPVTIYYCDAGAATQCKGHTGNGARLTRDADKPRSRIPIPHPLPVKLLGGRWC